MIISDNRDSSLQSFKRLITDATAQLNADAKGRAEYYLTRNGQRLEDDAEDVLKITAEGTEFEGSIRKVSGQKFPDIVAGKYYGIEVKSSKDDKWTTLGGSINESTRVKDIERIFLMFGKLTLPVEFRCRPYEDCLSDVVVTHYPRYKIDMGLGEGETLFDRMGTTYDAVRRTNDPTGKIVTHYRGELKDGESLWWSESPNSVEVSSAPMKIRLWSTLSKDEKNDQMTMHLALFPEILSSSSTKYERASLWSVSQHGIVPTSMRDTFSAGGRKNIKTRKEEFEKLPRIFDRIQVNREEIISQIQGSSEELLCETWRCNFIGSDRIGQWISIASSKCPLRNPGSDRVLKAIFDIDDDHIDS